MVFVAAGGLVTGPRRGEVWWAALPPPRGSEPRHLRPVIVVQSNRFNDSRIDTMVVASVTSNLRLADAPGNFRLTPAASGLPKTSVANVSQIISVGRSLLRSRAGVLPAGVMNEVADGLRLVLGL